MKSLVAFLLLLAGCGQSVPQIQGYGVTRTPTVDCTLTGATSQACIDPEALAQQKLIGRWIIERQPQDSFTLTTEDGLTIPGIFFPDDGIILPEPPCEGLGGLCFFARRKFESVDARDNNCTKFGELVVILRRVDDGTFTGVFADQSGSDENCGTSTIVQRIYDVTGVPDEEASLARQELIEE
jgi:hypothetical protein